MERLYAAGQTDLLLDVRGAEHLTLEHRRPDAATENNRQDNRKEDHTSPRSPLFHLQPP